MFELSPEEITSDPLYRVLPILTVPILFQNLVQVAQQVVDLFWIGRLGGDAIAAIGLTFPIVSLALIAIAVVPYVGTQVVTSQRIGADDVFGARRATFNGVVMGALLGAVVGIVTYVGAPTLVELVTATQPQTTNTEVRPLAVQYVRVLSLGFVVVGMGDCLEASLVARGDSRAAFHITVAAVVTNVTLDPFLIFGIGPVPALGVRGAAAASVLSYAASFAVAVSFVARGRSGGILSRESAVFDLDDARELIGVGLPPAAQRMNRRVADLLIVVVIFAAGGATGLSAYLIGTRVYLLASIPARGLQSAIQSVVGQNLGADRPDRAEQTTKVGIAFISALLIPITVFQWVAAGTITSVLAPGLDAETFETSVEFLRILAYSYPAFGVLYVIQGGFNGASRSRLSFFSSVFQFWLVQIPFAVAVGVVFANDLVLVFWSFTASKVLTALALGGYYVYATHSGMYERASRKADVTTAD